MLTVLGGLAEFERELIKARTGEGRAPGEGWECPYGPAAKLTPHQRREAIARRNAGEALTGIARTYGVSHTTIGRLTGAPSIWSLCIGRASVYRALDASSTSP